MPIFARHCSECHDGDEAEAKLQLTSSHGLLYGSVSGRVVVPGESAASLLLKVVAAEGKPHMPPEGQLSDAEIAVLAKFVDGLKGRTLPPRKLAGAADHWAYQPVAPQTPPPVKNAAWVRNPVDRFVLAKLEAAGLAPSPEADPVALCRRLYFDLTGLPPTPAEIDDFIRACSLSPPLPLSLSSRTQGESGRAGDREKAYSALVDKLLASPHYGERWGRHWLDLARYADSGGFHDDLDRPHAWRYRDYVIQSFNDDKPYAQFVAEQLAGDETAADDPQAWIATGFCRNGPSNDDNMGEGEFKERYRLDLLDDVISTASAVFLGQTIGCARCHDHKFDPISQTDYYRLLAVFDNTKRVDMAIDAEGRIVDAPKPPKGAKKEDVAKLPKASIMALADAGGTPRVTHVLFRGEVRNRGPAVTPGVPESMAFRTLMTDAAAASAKSAGRRRALAEWIAAPENPLAWRVVVNRMWQHHFGAGLVATPSNFGRTGAAPTHPELLDWLAREMVAGGGRWKPMHRMIVLSSAYRQASAPNAAAAKVDPTNRLIWRANERRLEAESLRDAVLVAAGSLNDTVGGPGIKPKIPADMLSASQRNKWPVVEREGREHWRRSVYIYVKRQLPFPMLELFDSPATTVTCECRTQSIVPTQALVLMNDEFTQQQAGLFADRVIREVGTSAEAQAALAVKIALGREATPVEISEAVAFLAERRIASAAAGCDAVAAAREGLIDFCHVLFNSNEFAFVD